MKESKIQLLSLDLERVTFKKNPRYQKGSSQSEDDSVQNFALQSAKAITKSPEFWDDDDKVDPEAKEHTYTVRLGIRTPLRESTAYPYQFEVIFSGVVVNFDHTDGDSDQLATKYGLALLYGAVRDQIIALSSKMKHGRLLLPTMSFDDDRYETLSAAHDAIVNKSAELASPPLGPR